MHGCWLPSKGEVVRVLLYGDIDLNLIDGSAIWLVSVAEVLAQIPDVEVVLLQRTRITRDVVVGGLRQTPNVTFVDPWDSPASLTANRDAGRPRGRRLDPDEAADRIVALDSQQDVDVLIVRSLETARLVHEKGVRARLWVYVTDPRQLSSRAGQDGAGPLLAECAGLLCQTDEARAVLIDLLGPGSQERIALLPPMIPEVPDVDREVPDPAAPRLGYGGKLAPGYMILETLDAFDEIRRHAPAAEFHVVGDKFHNVPAVPGFEGTVRTRLQGTPGVVWHGGVSRAEAASILDRVDVASSWRAPSFDDTVEMSTKILEYAALGIPILMNPSAVQARIFGTRYPGYVSTAADVVTQVLALTSSPEMYRQTSGELRQIARRFTFAQAVKHLEPVLRSARPRPSPTITKRVNGRVTARPHAAVRILVAGHDLKFLTPIISRLERNPRYEVLIDQYEGHVIRDPARSARLLERADLVFCEWCLGNAEWYSQHTRQDQPLIVRLHLQERSLKFLDRIDWDRVNRLIFIAPEVMQQCLAERPFLAEQSALIYNPIPCNELDQPKLEGAEHNLGLIGISPKRKGPHLAAQILERLNTLDRRYTLFIKGQAPWEHGWLWTRDDERRYYHDFYAQVRESPCVNSIVFDPPGRDVATWLTKIGIVLSTSDFEGSHQAVAEGMASGAIPAIRNWPGAAALYPERFVFTSVDRAVEAIRGRDSLTRRAEADWCRAFARRHFDEDTVGRQYEQLFADVLSSGRSSVGEAAGPRDSGSAAHDVRTSLAEAAPRAAGAAAW